MIQSKRCTNTELDLKTLVVNIPASVSHAPMSSGKGAVFNDSLKLGKASEAGRRRAHR